MPANTQYPNETGENFAKRIQGKAKQGGIVRAASRFMATAEQKKKKKEEAGSYS